VGDKNYKNNDDIYKTDKEETCGYVWDCNFDPKCIENNEPMLRIPSKNARDQK
jgi:hypothetical protein